MTHREDLDHALGHPGGPADDPYPPEPEPLPIYDWPKWGDPAAADIAEHVVRIAVRESGAAGTVLRRERDVYTVRLDDGTVAFLGRAQFDGAA